MRIPTPHLASYHFWGLLSVIWFRSTRKLSGHRPVSRIQWWLVTRQDAAYPPEHRRRTGGLPL
jgi:hypothetical protein